MARNIRPCLRLFHFHRPNHFPTNQQRLRKDPLPRRQPGRFPLQLLRRQLLTVVERQPIIVQPGIKRYFLSLFVARKYRLISVASHMIKI